MTPRFARILRRKHRYQERGVALAIALVLLGVLLVFTSVSATLMTTEARQTAADYQKTRTFNAAIAYLETITANVNRILSRSPNITADDLGPTGITSNLPPFVTEAGQPLYTFTADTPFVPPGASSTTTVTVNDAPFNGMTALRRQFVLGASARTTNANEEARLIRQVNFYQIPAFQFAVFGFDCLQVSPGPEFYLGGRAHVNRHLYLGAGNRAWFFGPVTVAGEIVTEVTPSNKTRANNSRVLDPNLTASGSTPRDLADSVTRPITPSLPNQKGPRGYSNDPAVYRVAPVNWLIDDINLAIGPGPSTPVVGAGPNNGGIGTPWGATNGQSPGKQRIVPLLLPTQTNGFNAIEILRRSNPNENLEVLRNSRFFEGQVSARACTIRILLDDDLDHFPPATSGGTRAYDLEALSNPNTALFQQFWVNDNPNVVQFNPLQGSDHPDQPASVLPAGSGGAPQKHNQSDTLATASGTQRRVLPPQTNLVNQQAYFQSTANNTDDTTRRKRTYIKIELLVNNNPGGNPNVFPTRYDITPHILNLGITAGPIPVLRDLPAANLAAGQPEPETTYAAVYALNDGGSVSRLQTQDPGNLPRNFLPFLSESATPSFIGRFAQTFGAPPTVAISSPAGSVNQRVTYWYEPNSILTLQRTMLPFTPQTDVNMANADPPQVDDRGRPVITTETASLRGRLDNDGNPSLTGYPARFKSLLAKPYFRFTDDFDNRSYIKGSYDIGPDGTRNTDDDMFLMPNPMKSDIPREEIFNGENSSGDKRQERFIRRVRVRAARLRLPLPNALPVADTTLHPIAMLMPDLNTPGNNPQYAPSVTAPVMAYETSFNQIMRSPNFWTNDPASPARVLRVERQLVRLLRSFVFRPGIPGFYAMRHDNLNILGNPVAAGAGASSLGDGRLDNDLDYLNQGPAAYPTSPAAAYITGPYTPTFNRNLNTTAADAPAAGDPPTDYPGTGPTGTVDLQEMTPFANVADQQLLAKCLFNPTGLTPAEQVRLFPHLLRAAPNFTVNFLQTLRGAELGTPGRSTDPSLGNIPTIGDFATAQILGTPEIARENLTFDWNGDGLIEPPHYPFENQRVDLNGVRRIPNNENGEWFFGDGDTNDLGEQMSALPRLVATTNPGDQGVARMGYSPESNVNSLLPSTLRVLHTPPAINNLNRMARRVTSMPIEIIFWEARQDDPDSTNFAPLPDPENGRDDILGQSDPGSTAAAFPPSTGFTETGEFQNCFRIKVPFNTFLGKTNPVNIPGVGNNLRFNVREAVGIIFQHPLASRVYPGAPGIDTAGIGATTPVLDGVPSPIGPGSGTQNLNLETQIGRRLGLGDANYAFPGHAYIAFQPNPGNPLLPPESTATLTPRIRIEMDRAFPINVYDQREGRHLNRRYSLQGIATASDYYNGDLGNTSGPNGVVGTVWPVWPGGGQLPDDQRILANMVYRLPMPSPIAYERRGVMNLTDLNVGNLKRLFRGDFDTYLANVEAATSGLTANPSGGFTSGKPLQLGGKIDVSDNGFVVYFSDRRGDFNNDGIYDFNDVFGENNVLNALDDSCETDPGTVSDPQQGGITVSYANVANGPGPKPGDGRLRRDVECETQPNFTPTLSQPARSGEAPHGAVPVNDGYEYFGGSANPNAATAGTGHGVVAQFTRYTYTPNPDGTRTIASTLSGIAYPSAVFPTSLTPAVNGGAGMRTWRIVDSAKTGRIRAFRRALRIVNAMDIPRFFVDRPTGNGRGFTGLTVATENPSYLYGNINAIGVTENFQNADECLNSRIPRGGPTPSENYAQTGNANMATPPPGDWCANPLEPNDPLLHGSMGIYSDATSIHSNGWSDGRMFITGLNYLYRPQNSLKRIAVRTTIKAAWLTGAPRTGSGNNNLTGQVQTSNNDAPDPPGATGADFDNNTDGGLHNFPRFAEDFGGASHSRNFNYNGSFIFQFFSHQGNGPFLIGGDGNYTPPNPRNWNFDTAFLVPTGVPAGTPFFFFYKNGSYRQVFLENNPN
ncbi:hypothetical protein J8C02_05120 [Chloracidobacterium sp. MS 40/45]|uniref:hypothetical protein n=1 Tax=Chloracidobacterium aggregatum TaxID=2851959 RepID=UPI001B8B535A|nr:hypothetical protein [Chloracidobacterium aggregatum]QUW00871.1 hypothetical protein J8C02_05120 [Chloracidobacterium sp. MS 40/45]